MRGIFSQGMILCASNGENFELLEPPKGSKPGDRVVCQTSTSEADAQLNPKEKVWEAIAPDLYVNDSGVAVFKDDPLFIDGLGQVTVPSLKLCKIS